MSFMLSAILAECRKQAQYAECRYAEFCGDLQTVKSGYYEFCAFVLNKIMLSENFG